MITLNFNIKPCFIKNNFCLQLLLYVLLFSSQAYSQDEVNQKDTLVVVPNTENKDSIAKVVAILIPNNLEKAIFKYRVSGDGNMSRGNVNRTLLILKGNFTYAHKGTDLSITPTYMYGDQNGDLAENDYSTIVFGNFYQRQRIYTWALGMVEHSHLRGVDFRTQDGGGIGFNFVPHTDTNAVSLTTGLVYEFVKYNTDSIIETWRSSTRFKGRHRFFKNKLRLSYEFYIQPSVVDINNFRARCNIALEFPLYKHLSFRTAILDSYESVVLPGKVQNDFAWTFGFSYGN